MLVTVPGEGLQGGSRQWIRAVEFGRAPGIYTGSALLGKAVA